MASELSAEEIGALRGTLASVRVSPKLLHPLTISLLGRHSRILHL